MPNTNEAQDDCINVSEIEMLVSWILGRMGAQMRAMCRKVFLVLIFIRFPRCVYITLYSRRGQLSSFSISF